MSRANVRSTLATGRPGTAQPKFVSPVPADRIPTIPHDPSNTLQRTNDRAFQLALARTSYNYMKSYLYPLPLSAGVPSGETFTLDYEVKVAEVFIPLAANFVQVVGDLLRAHLQSHLPPDPIPELVATEQALAELKEQIDGLSKFNVVGDVNAMVKVIDAVATLPKALGAVASEVGKVPKDVEQMVTGLAEVFRDFTENGVTAFLKNTLYDMLSEEHGRDYLRATSFDDYAGTLFKKIETPAVYRLTAEDWMALAPGERPGQTDWYFGWLQIAGFNTTQLKGIFAGDPPALGLHLSSILAKAPFTDEMLRTATGNPEITLAQAVAQGRLFGLDFTNLHPEDGSHLHGERRYVTAPIALFYWNDKPPKGYPTGRPSMQPIAIQIGQKHDPEDFPIYTPADGVKWQIARWYVNNSLALQHETVAHLGECHLMLEPFLLAAHRQLSAQHPILVLLTPHFRFTIQINDSALHSLVIPGGVVASVLSTSIEGSQRMLLENAASWRFEQKLPTHLFGLRGVDASRLPEFPFRDDALAVWNVIRRFVRSYLGVYYANDAVVVGDTEVQGWVNELIDERYGGLKGFDRLVPDPAHPGKMLVDSIEHLVDIVSLVMYTAGPQHASVNYPQWPMMSYLPSVSGTAYAPPPKASDPAPVKPEDYLLAPPLDVALYQASFGYLLSGVQYDRFGTYENNPRRPYLIDQRVQGFYADFQDDLNVVEHAIRVRNADRPSPFFPLLPSRIPNSISI